MKMYNNIIVRILVHLSRALATHSSHLLWFWIHFFRIIITLLANDSFKIVLLLATSQFPIVKFGLHFGIFSFGLLVADASLLLRRLQITER